MKRPRANFKKPSLSLRSASFIITNLRAFTSRSASAISPVRNGKPSSRCAHKLPRTTARNPNTAARRKAMVLVIRKRGRPNSSKSANGVKTMDWKNWTPRERANLCFILKDDRLLLIRKKRGLGAGKINAPGGKIDPGETALESAIRETREEVGVVPH